MRAYLGLTVLALAAASASAAVVPLYDGFNYTTGQGLGGQVAPNGMTWSASTTGTADNVIGSASDNLSYAGLPASTGNAVLETNGTGSGRIDRINVGDAPIGTGDLFYSLLIKVTDLTGSPTGTTGSFVAGFNNTSAPTTSGLSQAATRLQIRKDSVDGTKYNFGVRSDNASANGTSPIAWETTQRNVGDTYLIVGEYSFNPDGVTTSTTNDIASMWINPASSTFGADSAPAADLTSTGGDISQLQIASFFFRQNPSAPKSITFDELRLGTSWASVTSVPEPASLGLLGLGALGLLSRRRRHA